MSVFEKLKYIQLDVDPWMDDNASPMSSNIGACWEYLLERFQFFGANQNTSQISISNFFEKKIEFVGFYVIVLVKTFPLMY